MNLATGANCCQQGLPGDPLPLQISGPEWMCILSFGALCQSSLWNEKRLLENLKNIKRGSTELGKVQLVVRTQVTKLRPHEEPPDWYLPRPVGLWANIFLAERDLLAPKCRCHHHAKLVDKVLRVIMLCESD